MQRPVSITYRFVDPSPSLRAHVQTQAAKLDAIFPRLVSCRVVLEGDDKHKHGDRYHVRIDLAVPGTELVVTRNAPDEIAHDDLHAAIDRAFDDARRVLRHWAERRRGDVKTHDGAHRRGVVTKIFHYEGYGFLEGDDGVEVYFHRNAVRHVAFESLQRGTAVSFLDEPGEKGPQATVVEAFTS